VAIDILLFLNILELLYIFQNNAFYRGTFFFEECCRYGIFALKFRPKGNNMKKCRECQHDVSEQVLDCPNCGAPYPAKEKWDS